MKKQVLFAGIFFLALTNSHAGTYERVTRNGGEHGYNSTNKTVDENGNTTISCYDPGHEPCPSSVANPNVNYLVNYAIASIQRGQLGGGLFKNGKSLIWVSLDKAMTTSTIQINDIYTVR